MKRMKLKAFCAGALAAAFSFAAMAQDGDASALATQESVSTPTMGYLDRAYGQVAAQCAEGIEVACDRKAELEELRHMAISDCGKIKEVMNEIVAERKAGFTQDEARASSRVIMGNLGIEAPYAGDFVDSWLRRVWAMAEPGQVTNNNYLSFEGFDPISPGLVAEWAAYECRIKYPLLLNGPIVKPRAVEAPLPTAGEDVPPPATVIDYLNGPAL